MDFFENLGTTISSKSKDVAKKAKELAEVAGLNGQISSQEDRLNRVFMELGRSVYESCKSMPDNRWSELFRQADEASAEIEQLKEERNKIKGVRLCPQCSRETPNDALFCPGCGVKLPEDVFENEQEQAQEAKTENAGAEAQINSTEAQVNSIRVQEDSAETPEDSASGMK